MNWNPFKKKPPTGVYVQVKMDGPFGAITEADPGAMGRPFIYFSDLDISQAAREIPGKSINWHAVPMSIRERLEIDPWRLDMEWGKLKEWVR